MTDRLKILLLAAAAAAAAGCPDPEPDCPEQCEEIREGKYLVACRCDPGFFDDHCKCEEPAVPTEEECEEIYW